MSKLPQLYEMSKSSPNSGIFPLSSSLLSTWRSQFFDLAMNRLAQNVCTARDPISASLRQDQRALTVPGKERHEVPKLTKSTVGGPNWICRGLDLLRLAMHKECELSPAFLFYWHKLERCNYLLNAVTECLERCEPLDGRTFKYLMKHAVPDAGNWQMFVNLVQKYGVMPKQSYLPSWSSTRTLHLNRILRSKLHEFSSQLHARYTLDGDRQALQLMVESMMAELYKIISICLGTPPLDFRWSAKDDDHKPLFTPLCFYKSMIRPFHALDAKVCLGHDPRLNSSYQRNYHVAYSSNMVGGLKQSYNNQPMEVLLQIIVNSLEAGVAVWLACDKPLIFSAKSEVLSLKTHNFDQVFGMAVGTDLTKAERMLYKATRRNTVLLLRAVTLDALRQPLQFGTICNPVEATTPKKTPSTESVEAPKQDAVKRKGPSGQTTVLNVDWLQEYAFEIVVDARFVPPGVMHALQAQPSVELPIWDPMGGLLS